MTEPTMNCCSLCKCHFEDQKDRLCHDEECNCHQVQFHNPSDISGTDKLVYSNWRDEFKEKWPRLYKHQLSGDYIEEVLDDIQSTLHSTLERIENELKNKMRIMYHKDSAQHIRNMQNNETLEDALSIIRAEKERAGGLTH